MNKILRLTTFLEALNMTDPYEYDVFLSFSSADEAIVKPIWQELSSNGLRVFWSDATLKKEVGNSWFDVIEKSLERSKHMLLVCSENSMNSKWVQREYRAFFDYCYSPGSRRLIPLLTRGFKAGDLPLFLRELQVGKIDDSRFIQELIPLLGGINIDKLQHEVQALKEQVDTLFDQNKRLNELVGSRSEENRALGDQVNLLLRLNKDLGIEFNKLSGEFQEIKYESMDRSKKLAAMDYVLFHLQEKNELIEKAMESLEAREKDIERYMYETEKRQQFLEFEIHKAKQEALDKAEAKKNYKVKRPKSIASGEPNKLDPTPRPLTRLRVGNLEKSIEEADLLAVFSQAGVVNFVEMVIDRQTRRSKGLAFVEMSTTADAQNAINMFNGKDLKGRALEVFFEHPGDDDNSYSYY